MKMRFNALVLSLGALAGWLAVCEPHANVFAQQSPA